VSEHRVERTGVGAWTVYGPSLEQPATLPNPNDAQRIAAALNQRSELATQPQAEPLFLLHTGAIYGNERGDWDIEANSGKAVDAYCDANPGKTVGLYLAPPQAQPAQPVVERYGDGVLVHWPEGMEQYVQVGDCVTGKIEAPPAAVPSEVQRDAERWRGVCALYAELLMAEFFGHTFQGCSSEHIAETFAGYIDDAMLAAAKKENNNG